MGINLSEPDNHEDCTCMYVGEIRPKINGEAPNFAVRRNQKNPSGGNSHRRSVQSSSVPIKIPEENYSFCCNHHNHQHRTEPHYIYRQSPMQQYESDHLQHLYDMQTWDMYTRITEARSKRATNVTTTISHRPGPGQNGHHAKHQQQDTAETASISLPPSQIDDGYLSRGIEDTNMDGPGMTPNEVGSYNQVMIFGDLE
jgi:hypothetical protein